MVEDYNFYDDFNRNSEEWGDEESPTSPTSLARANYLLLRDAQYRYQYSPTKHIRFVSMCQKSIDLARSCFCILHIERDLINGCGKIILKFPTRWGCTTDDEGTNVIMGELLLLYPDFLMSIEDDFIVMQFNEIFAEKNSSMIIRNY